MSDNLPARRDDLEVMERAFVAFDALGRASLLPKHCQNPADAAVVAAYANGLGQSVTWGLRNMHVIEGKPTLSADAMAALAMAHPDCEYLRPVSITSDGAVYEAKRRGWPEPIRIDFTTEDARAAGLLGKDNWKRHPKAMMKARCLALICRAAFPDALSGVYEHSELERDDPPRRGAPRGESRARPDVVDADFTPGPPPHAPATHAPAPIRDRPRSPREPARIPREGADLPAEVFAERCRAVGVDPNSIDRFRQWATGGAPSLAEPSQGWSRDGLLRYIEGIEAFRIALAIGVDSQAWVDTVEHIAASVEAVAPTNSAVEALRTTSPGEKLWKAVKAALAVLLADTPPAEPAAQSAP